MDRTEKKEKKTEQNEKEEEDDDEDTKTIKKTIASLNPKSIILGAVVLAVTKNWQDTLNAMIENSFPKDRKKNVWSRVLFSTGLTAAAIVSVHEFDLLNQKKIKKEKEKLVQKETARRSSQRVSVSSPTRNCICSDILCSSCSTGCFL